MTTPPILRQLRHDVWATEKVIAHCRTLSDAQLELTAPGTYGTIRRTLEHIVAADTRYLARIGQVVIEPPFREDHDVSLDEIAALLDKVKAAVERVFAGKEFDPDRFVLDTVSQRAPGKPPIEMEPWMMVHAVPAPRERSPRAHRHHPWCARLADAHAGHRCVGLRLGDRRDPGEALERSGSRLQTAGETGES